MARANRESLLRRVGSDLDSIDVDTVSNAWLKAVLVIWVFGLHAWGGAENDVVGLDLLHRSNQNLDVEARRN